MNLNRDEFLLLSRTGRSLHSTRAGPQPSEMPEFDRELRPSRGLLGRRSGLLLRSGGRERLRHRLGRRAGRSARASRTLGYADENAYFELEFAVGFPVEEESVR